MEALVEKEEILCRSRHGDLKIINITNHIGMIGIPNRIVPDRPFQMIEQGVHGIIEQIIAVNALNLLVGTEGLGAIVP